MSNNGTNTNTSGDSVVSFDFTEGGASDCLSNQVMEEITRRLIGLLNDGTTGDVVVSPISPQDTTKIWIESNVSGNPIGPVYFYDSSSATWVALALYSQIPSQTVKVFNYTVASADAVNSFPHSLGTEEFFYTVTPQADPTVDGRWYEVSRDASNLDLRFLDMSGVDVQVKIVTHVTPT